MQITTTLHALTVIHATQMGSASTFALTTRTKRALNVTICANFAQPQLQQRTAQSAGSTMQFTQTLQTATSASATMAIMTVQLITHAINATTVARFVLDL